MYNYIVMKVYWTTKDGRVMDVDDMSDTHVRNAFKMVLRKLTAEKEKLEAEIKQSKHHVVTLNGDASNDFNDSMDFDELCDATECDFH